MSGGAPLDPDPVTLLFRHVVRQRVRTLFPARRHVLEITGSGLDTVGLAPAGLEVHTFDPSTASPDVGSLRDLDGAFAGPGALEGAELTAVGRALAVALRPGAPVLLCVGPRRAERIRLREARARLGPDLVWRSAFALGVIVPDESAQEWVRGHPQAFGVLAAVEGLVRRWPLLRARGEFTVIEGARR